MSLHLSHRATLIGNEAALAVSLDLYEQPLTDMFINPKKWRKQ
jgi:hypothetical protein